MYTIDCINCNFTFEVDYGDIGDIFICPQCGAKQSICYQEDYDEDANEDYSYFYMSKV